MDIEQEQHPIKVFLADSHELVRLGFQTLILGNKNINLVGESNSFSETLTLVHSQNPDVIVMDIELSEGNIVERIPELLAIYPTGKILLCTTVEDYEINLLALRLGVLGIFSKKLSNEILLKAINSVFYGEVWVNRTTTALLLRNYNELTLNKEEENDLEISSGIVNKQKTDKLNLLTRREINVAHLAAQGMSAKIIASKLFISEKTVRNQLTSIYSKLDVASQLELALQANSLGLFDNDKPH